MRLRWMLGGLAALLLASAAPAITITVIAPDGSAGALGAPGAPGGEGGDGEDAATLADDVDDALDRAEAFAGDGGNGGKGGDGTAESQDGGDGGDGGNGGDASATALNEREAGAATAEALAQGGAGGIAGSFGSAGPGGEPGAPGEGGGAGDAAASATASSASATATAQAQAIGGDSRGRGAGGSAAAEARAQTFGAGQNATAGGGTVFPSGSNAVGGDGGNSSTGPGGDGGDAVSQTVALAHGSGAVAEARDVAVGGSSGESSVGPGGRGGDATSYAEARGAGGAVAEAEAGAGAGGVGIGGGDGGVASASAYGESSEGSVRVTVRQFGGAGRSGAGADSTLADAARGVAAGELRLSQLAHGGWAGAGPAGDANSSFDVSHTGEGPLLLHSEAVGGRAPLVGAIPGGDAFASARGEARGDVTITGHATGGQAFNDSLGGAAELGELFGRSLEGGTVRVTGRAVAGSSNGPAGRSVRVENAVGGETSGALVLQQDAVASGARSAPGSAESLLTRSVEAGSASGGVSARGGRNNRGGTGGTATARIDLHNGAGPVNAAAYAEAGESFGTPDAGAPGAGGAAEAEARASSDGDGNDVTVGLAGFASFGARGGAGGSALSGPGGVGGQATSRSTGTAFGDSTVTVEDVAIGGEGGRNADGGAALSHAEGSNQGASAVGVSALARGGRAIGAQGGDAQASASGRSQDGAVSVAALALAGRSHDADGRDLEQVDAVSGSTAGRLLLDQEVHGGEVSPSLGGAFEGGTARSTLAASNPGGGELEARATAVGGFSETGTGGAGEAAVSAEGASRVVVDAHAIGGFGRLEGGTATITSAFGRSTRGKEVIVRARQEGGAAFVPGGRGADSVIENAVDGSTTGRLVLQQWAIGGAGALSGALFGIGGSASSRLDRSAECSELNLSGHAQGAFASAGDGADAFSDARATNLLGSVFGNAFSQAGGSAGGLAGAVTAHGGDAEAYAEAVREAEKGSKKEPLRAIATSDARAGGGGHLTGGDGSHLADAVGGAATAEAHARGRGLTATSASAVATGGAGGSVDAAGGERTGADGGDAHAVASAEGEGSGAVFASAQANGGAAGGLTRGSAGAGGTATASAFGRSNGGGAVQVEVSVGAGDGAFVTDGDGGDVSVAGAVSGGTAGRLTLRQSAFGGAGKLGGDGGRAESILDATNPGGGALDVSGFAAGGDGALGGAGFASVVGTGHGAEAVRVEARALGGNGGPGGAAELGRVFGNSPGGGAVTVIGAVSAGRAGFGEPPGPRTNAQLVNAVDGATSGALLLAQSASAGGEAVSLLARQHTSQSLTLSSVASGVGARAVAEATNPSGIAHAHALAEALEGGDASSEARATSSANGAAVLVNVPIPGLDPTQQAYGARTGPAFGGLPAPGGATSLAVGTHLGDGVVAVLDEARAGDSWDLEHDGGSASSHARATNAGRSQVGAVATAVGGHALVSDALHRPAGGNAEALAEASGLGRVGVGARAEAGLAQSIETSGTAFATAVGSGPRTASAAEALSEGLLAARAGAIARGAATTQAGTAAGNLAAGNALFADAWAYAAHSLDDEALVAALAGNDAVADAMSGASALALGAFGGGGLSGRITLGAEIELGADLLGVSAFDQLLVGFLDPTLLAGASLRIEVVADGQTVLRARLRPGALASLDDTLLSLDVAPTESLRIAIEMKLKDGASAGSLDFVVGGVPPLAEAAGAGTAAQTGAALLALAAPEPGLGVLLGVGLIALARRRAPGSAHPPDSAG